MRMFNKGAVVGPVVIGVASCFLMSNATAAGFALIENSATGMGNAFAGGAASAEDASTVWFNPAGMSYLGNDLVAAAHIIMPKSSFTDTNSTTSAAMGGTTLDPTNTERTGEGGRNALVPNLYWVKNLTSDVTAGIGFNAPFGLGTEYDDDWIGRYHAVKSDTATFNINPSIAYKTGNMSLGFGLNAQYIDVTLTSAIDLGTLCFAQESIGTFPAGFCSGLNALPQQRDGFAELTADNWAFGYNFGLMFDLSAKSRVGFSYRSSVDHDVEGQADFTVPGELSFLQAPDRFTDSALTATVSLPAMYSLSYYNEISRELTIMMDYSMTLWSGFEELRIEYASGQDDTVTTENWEDSARYSVGMNYRAADDMLLRFGIAYDNTPVPDDAHRTPRIPGSDRTWLSFGFSKTLAKDLVLSLGYSHLFLQQVAINNTYETESAEAVVLEHTLTGTYDNSIDIISAQVEWKY